jgi:hypothetical protein
VAKNQSDVSHFTSPYFVVQENVKEKRQHVKKKRSQDYIESVWSVPWQLGDGQQEKTDFINKDSKFLP